MHFFQGSRKHRPPPGGLNSALFCLIIVLTSRHKIFFLFDLSIHVAFSGRYTVINCPPKMFVLNLYLDQNGVRYLSEVTQTSLQ